MKYHQSLELCHCVLYPVSTIRMSEIWDDLFILFHLFDMTEFFSQNLFLISRGHKYLVDFIGFYDFYTYRRNMVMSIFRGNLINSLQRANNFERIQQYFIFKLVLNWSCYKTNKINSCLFFVLHFSQHIHTHTYTKNDDPKKTKIKWLCMNQYGKLWF